MAILGHVIYRKGVMVDPQKIKIVKNWTWPSLVTEVRRFIGFACYYRKFLKNFVSIAMHLTRLIHKQFPLIWSDQCKESFQKLKIL